MLRHLKTTVPRNSRSQSRKNLLVIRSLYLNPEIVYNKKSVMQNIFQMLKDPKYSKGIVADGVSRVLIVANYEDSLKFSLTGSSDVELGSLNSISQLKSVNMSQSNSNSIIVEPIHSKHHRQDSLVAVVYKGPSYVNMHKNTKNVAITISVSDVKKNYIQKNIKIKVYRAPVLLIHGIWSSPNGAWKETGFKQFLQSRGFKVSMVDYARHNAETFDPKAELKIGNHAIAALKSTILEVLEGYNKKYISASQVDIVAHSIGGLIARGLCQQRGYKAKENYMKGQIHRLITIGSPHFGADLAGILYRLKDDWYSYNKPFIALWNSSYEKDPNYRRVQLKDIYSKELKWPLDKGAVESLAPDSAAYPNLLPTNVKSYAIAGSWKPDANTSHNILEENLRNILGNPFFSLDRDGFHGDNDLQVSISSQLGGLDGKHRRNGDKNMPKFGAIYINALHSSGFNFDDIDKVSSELKSDLIRNDVANLLGSSDEIFADMIGGIPT